MKMIRMSKDKFFSYVRDERKSLYRSQIAEVYYSNPQDARGDRSSFVMVVILTAKMGTIYAGVSKYNPLDTILAQRPVPSNLSKKQQNIMKPTVKVSGFSLEEGLRQACNRAWREFLDMPSIYGKDHGKPERPGKAMEKLRFMVTEAVRHLRDNPLPFNSRTKYRELMTANDRISQKKLLARKDNR